jgi:succinyl-diaminopimelate desuccinylase
MTSVVELAAELVRIPSQGGIDPPDAILARIAEWLREREIAFTLLEDEERRPVGLFVTVNGAEPGPTLCLDACVDTAPIGDPGQWTLPPFCGRLVDGWLHGRGAADSKLGAAILLQLAEQFSDKPPARGILYILFDADEHTGEFGGVKAFLDAAPTPPTAMVLGYPGHDAILRGARGFLRCDIEVRGRSAHSGSINRRGVNAISKAARLVTELDAAALPTPQTFPIAPSLTITQIKGGEGYSQVPDKAVIGLDVRLTPEFDQNRANAWIRAVMMRFDASEADGLPTCVNRHASWPAYEISDTHPVVQSFQAAGERALKNAIGTAVCGPSNIGNLLATWDIATICGLGAEYSNLHAANERVSVADVELVLEAWEFGARTFLC